MSNVGSQSLRVGTFQRHLLQRKQRKATRKRVLVAGLTLTSMVDMFSLLVIFLLQTFSTSPEMMAVTKGVVLPAAISGRELDDAPVLSVSNEGVFLDQKLIGSTQSVLADPSALLKRLAELRELWQRTHPNEKFKGIISLQGDKDLPSTLISQIMGVLPSEAYSSVQLAVVSRGGS